MLERTGTILGFQKTPPYSGREVGWVPRPVAVAYEEGTHTLLVLGESGHSVFRVDPASREAELLFKLDQHYTTVPYGGLAVDPDGHIILNNAKVRGLPALMVFNPDGTFFDGLGQRQSHEDPALEVTINAARLRTIPHLIALYFNIGILKTIRGNEEIAVDIPPYKGWEPPRKKGENVVTNPYVLDVAPINSDLMFLLASVKPRVFGYVLDHQLNRIGIVRLSRTPDWVASNRYQSVCRIDYDKYVLAAPGSGRLDVYELR